MKMNRQTMIEILEDYYGYDKHPDFKYCLAVDFDNTLCYSNYPYCGEETPVCDFLRSIQDLDMVIIINTCRATHQAKRLAKKWLKRHDIRWDYFNKNDSERLKKYKNCRKIFCNMLIDDTSYNFNMDDFKEE